MTDLEIECVQVCKELLCLDQPKALELQKASMALEQQVGTEIALTFTILSAKSAITKAKLEALLP